MNLKEYQRFVIDTARMKAKFWYACLGLAGETGEVIEIVKKLVRDSDSEVTDEIRTNVKLELGDVLWYMVRLANDFDISLEEIIEANVEKLTTRYPERKNRLNELAS